MRVAFKKIASSASSKVCTEAASRLDSTGIFAALEKSKNAQFNALTWLLILIPIRTY